MKRLLMRIYADNDALTFSGYFLRLSVFNF